jgi:hypothetical protein
MSDSTQPSASKRRAEWHEPNCQLPLLKHLATPMKTPEPATRSDLH